MKKSNGLIKWLLVFVIVLGVAMLTGASAELGSGTCGDNLTWVLSDEGVLTISGTGEMISYTYFAPEWLNLKNDIKMIDIRNGATNIGNNAFSRCTNLTTVIIPGSVVSIGNNAFNGCGNLTSVYISEGLVSIDFYAFNECRSLTNLFLPESVSSISHRAFTECSSLVSFTIPENVTSIGEATFSGCTNLTTVTIPENVSSIGMGAFWNCQSLRNITIPEGVTVIDGETFMGCERLTNITIPENVTRIEYSAFSGCNSLTSVTIPDGVTFIGSYAFSECRSMQKATIPDSVTFIGENAFDRSVTTLKVSSTSTYAYEWATSNRCKAMSDTIIYNRTGGNPVGEPEKVPYGTWSEDTEEEGMIHSLTRQSLDNGYVRFVLQYTVPEMLEISAFNPPDGDVFAFYEWHLRTSSERSTLQFEVSEEQISTISNVTIMFMRFIGQDRIIPFALSFKTVKPERVSNFKLNTTNGTPVGKPEKVRFATWKNPMESHNYFQSVTRQKLNNGYARFVFKFSAPADLHLFFYVVQGEKRIFNYYTGDFNQCTASGNSTLTFDINEKELKTNSDFYIYINKYEDFEKIGALWSSSDNEFIDSVKTLILPADLQTIEDEAFTGLNCEGVMIPKSCTTIRSKAFSNCVKLGWIRLPENVEIAPDAFEGCGEMWVERIPASGTN